MTRITTKLADAFHAHRTDFLVLLVLSLFALVIRIGYLAEYPNSIMHEDSGPYVDEAERLLEGRATKNGEIPGRAPGYPLFLAAIISLVSPKLLYTVGIQHVLGIGTALLLTLSLRMLGVGRLLSYGFFIAVAFAHRLIHYDNTIGAETLTVFLLSLNVLLVTGMALRHWNPWGCAAAIGLVFGYLILVRSATFFIPFVFAFWLILPMAKFCSGWRQRLALMALILIPSVLAVVGMTQWNKVHYNRAVLSREAEPVMAFVIAYSGDFSEQGPKYDVLENYPGFREKLNTVVEEGRATLKSDGYSSVHHYQWVFGIFDVLDLKHFGSQQEKDRVVAGLFWETVFTPQTLFRHVTEHTLRELRFMLLDSTPVANSTVPPLELVNFTRRDGSVLRIAEAAANHQPGTGIRKLLPNVLGVPLQRFTNRYIHNKYTTEYRQKPGLMRLYTVLSIATFGIMAIWLLFSATRSTPAGGISHFNRPALDTKSSVALLIFTIWIGNAVLISTLTYALHRYSYYVMPFAALTAFYGLDRLTRYVQAVRNN
jgi:hypothetical protein